MKRLHPKQLEVIGQDKYDNISGYDYSTDGKTDAPNCMNTTMTATPQQIDNIQLIGSTTYMQQNTYLMNMKNNYFACHWSSGFKTEQMH